MIITFTMASCILGSGKSQLCVYVHLKYVKQAILFPSCFLTDLTFLLTSIKKGKELLGPCWYLQPCLLDRLITG